MITLTIAERRKDGSLTGKTISENFQNAGAVAAWYNRQPGHRIDRELEQAEKGISLIPHKRG